MILVYCTCMLLSHGARWSAIHVLTPGVQNSFCTMSSIPSVNLFSLIHPSIHPSIILLTHSHDHSPTNSSVGPQIACPDVNRLIHATERTTPLYLLIHPNEHNLWCVTILHSINTTSPVHGICARRGSKATLTNWARFLPTTLLTSNRHLTRESHFHPAYIQYKTSLHIQNFATLLAVYSTYNQVTCSNITRVDRPGCWNLKALIGVPTITPLPLLIRGLPLPRHGLRELALCLPPAPVDVAGGCSWHTGLDRHTRSRVACCPCRRTTWNRSRRTRCTRPRDRASWSARRRSDAPCKRCVVAAPPGGQREKHHVKML